MKRLVPLALLVLLAAAPLFAGGPMFSFEAGEIGFDLPEDTVVTEEEGIWYGVSESTELLVIIAETAEFCPPNEMSEAMISASLGDLELRDFEYVGVAGDSVVLVYGKAFTTDNDGDEWEGYFGILQNGDVPDKTFVISATSPLPLSKKADKAVQAMIASFESLGPESY